jgi:hypothetical protein
MSRASSISSGKFAVVWVLACAVGLSVAYSAPIVPTIGLIHGSIPVVRILVNWAVLGAIIGVLQWAVLRPKIRKAALWIPLTAVGWGIAMTMCVLTLPRGRSHPAISLVMQLLLPGLVIGAAQWSLFRGHVRRAHWWIAACFLSWILADLSDVYINRRIGYGRNLFPGRTLATILGEDVRGFLCGAIAGACWGLVTGTMLVILLRRPTSRSLSRA